MVGLRTTGSAIAGISKGRKLSLFGFSVEISMIARAS